MLTILHVRLSPDPILSIRELGVPLKIAKNLTKPVKVNKTNKSYLTYLVQNGPDVHPGAKSVERKNGDEISLRFVVEIVSFFKKVTLFTDAMNGDYCFSIVAFTS